MPNKVHPSCGGRLDKKDMSCTSPPLTPEEAKPMLPPSKHVIQIPRDQIYRIPPPGNAHKFKLYTHRGERHRRRSCCFFLTCFIAVVLFLVMAAGVLCLVFRPKLPSYSVESVAVSGLDLSITGNIFSPAIDVVVRAENPNEKMELWYKERSWIRAFYSDVELCKGKWPAFQHERRNSTVVRAELVGSGIKLSNGMLGDLTAEEKRGSVGLRILAHILARVKLGAVTTWTFTVNIRCDVTVNNLGKNAKIRDGSKRCKIYLVKLFS